jgi:hypothetical protein
MRSVGRVKAVETRKSEKKVRKKEEQSEERSASDHCHLQTV